MNKLPVGIEPTTYTLQVYRSTNWAITALNSGNRINSLPYENIITNFKNFFKTKIS